MENLTFDQLLQVAKSNPEGFTIDKQGNEVTSGLACAVTNGKEDFNTASVDEVYSMVMNSDELVFGGWYDNKEDVYYIDAVKILPHSPASLRFAEAHKQRSVYDLNSKQVIEL